MTDEYKDVVEQTEKYLSMIPEHLQGDNENDLVSLLRRNYVLLKRYREGLGLIVDLGEYHRTDSAYKIARKTLGDSHE